MKKNLITFKEKRLLSRMETPEFREKDISEVKQHKEAKGKELDTKSLVDKSNELIDKHEDEFEGLPPEFNQKFHDEVVTYFLASPGRYDKDTAKGLSEGEFSNYRKGMLKTLGDMVSQYAPSKEDKEKIAKAQKSAEQAKESAKKIKPIDDPNNIPTDPGYISTLDDLGSAYKTYQGFNGSIQKESTGMLKAVGKFRGKIADYKKVRNGIGAFKKTIAYFAPQKDKERIILEEGVTWAKNQIAETIERFNTAKERLRKYGKALSEKSNDKKQITLKERGERLKEMDARGKESGKQEAIRRRKYEELSKHKEGMEAEREKIASYRSDVEKQYSAKDLNQYGATVKNARSRVQKALKSKGLTPEQKKRLKIAEEILGDQSNSTSKKIKRVAKAKINLDEKDAGITSHIEQDVNPTLIMLDSSIHTIGEARIKYASSKEQIIAHYEKRLENFDNIDKTIDESVLQNNLANDKMFKSLTDEKASIDRIDISPPSGVTGFLESTVTPVYAMIGGGIMEGGEYMIDKGRELHSVIDLAHKQKQLTGVAYAGARTISELLEATIGFTGGAVEIVGGLINMASHPVDTLSGIGGLIGRNPETGEFSWDTSKNTLGEMGKVIISYDDFKNGRIGLGIGKIIPGIILAIETSGAGTAGKVAASTAFKEAGLAGEHVVSAFAKGGIAFAKEAAIDTAKTVKSLPSKAKALPGQARDLAGKAKEYTVGLKDRLKPKEKGGTAAEAATVAAETTTETANHAAKAQLNGDEAISMVTTDGIRTLERFERHNGRAIAGKSPSERKAILLEKHRQLHARRVDTISNPKYLRDAKFESVTAESAVMKMSEYFDDYQTLKLSIKSADQTVVKQFFEFKKAVKLGKENEFIAKLSIENPSMANGFKYLKAQGEYMEAVTKMRGLNVADTVATLLHGDAAKDLSLLRSFAKNRRLTPEKVFQKAFEALYEEGKIIDDISLRLVNEGLIKPTDAILAKLGDKAVNIADKYKPKSLRKKQEPAPHKAEPVHEVVIGAEDAGNHWLTKGASDDVARLGEELLADLKDRSPESIRARLKQAREELSTHVEGISDPTLLGEAKSLQNYMKILEKNISENYEAFQRLEGLLKKGDKMATDLVLDYLKTIDDKPPYIFGKVDGFPSEWQGALRYIGTQKEYMRKIDRIKALAKYDKTAVELVMGVDNPAEYLRGLAAKATNKEDVSVLGKIIENAFKDDDISSAVYLKLVEEGKAHLSKRTMSKLIIRDEKVPIKLFKNGEIPLDNNSVQYFLRTRERVKKLEEILEGGKAKFEKGLDINGIRKSILEEMPVIQIKEDLSVINSLWTGKRKDFGGDVKMALRAIESGHPGEQGLVGVLRRLKEKDPEGFRLLKASDAEMLVETECLQSMILGNKIAFENIAGQKITGYPGRNLGKGNFGEVHDVAYVVEGEKVLRHAAIKNAHVGKEAALVSEGQGALRVNTWKNPVLLKTEQVGKGYIITETGIESVNLTEVLRKANPSAAEQVEHLKSLIDIVDGLEEYNRRGFFHSDIKEANILRMKMGTHPDGTPKFVTKIIDNNPVENMRPHTPDGTWAYTEGYAFGGEQLKELRLALKAQKVSDKVRISRTARAMDARAYGQMLNHTFDQFIGKAEWPKDPALKKIVESFLDPVSASDPTLYARTVPKLKIIMDNIQHGRPPSTGVPIDDIIKQSSIRSMLKQTMQAKRPNLR